MELGLQVELVHVLLAWAELGRQMELALVLLVQPIHGPQMEQIPALTASLATHPLLVQQHVLLARQDNIMTR